jgi:hypothetical protein
VRILWNWFIIRLKTTEELAARRSLRRRVGKKIWRALTLLRVAEVDHALAETLADELDTRRLSQRRKSALSEAKHKGALPGSGEQLPANLTAPEREALRHVVDEARRYGRVTPFIEERLVRYGRPVKIRPRPDDPIRRHPKVRQALRKAHTLLARVSPDPLGELVRLLPSEFRLQAIWQGHDLAYAQTKEAREAAERRLREMIRRELRIPQ